jgi:anaerobic glycerol-3-phosphate dehydrogenase
MPEAGLATSQGASKIKEGVMSVGIVSASADSGEKLEITRQKFWIKIDLITDQATTACKVKHCQNHANFVRAAVAIVGGYFKRREFAGVGVYAHDQYLTFSEMNQRTPMG